VKTLAREAWTLRCRPDQHEFLRGVVRVRITRDHFIQLAQKLGWLVAGPQHAFLVQGDDHLGALADIQRMLLEADVKIYASSGITDGSGRYGYVIYFKEDDHERAARALGAVMLAGTTNQPV
jgi:hypothetical protein